MTQYAYYLSTEDNTEVTGWLDTVIFKYPKLPATENLLELTPAQWNVRISGGPWAVTKGQLVPWQPPAPTPAQVAQTSYAALIAGGLAITSESTPALNGAYKIDGVSYQAILSESMFINVHGEFTSGSTTNLPWVLLNGTAVTFPNTATFLSFAKVAGQVVSAANTALQQSTTMPVPEASIP